MPLAPCGELAGGAGSPESSKVSTDSVDNSLDNLFNPRFKADKPLPPADWLFFNHPSKIYKYHEFTYHL